MQPKFLIYTLLPLVTASWFWRQATPRSSGRAVALGDSDLRAVSGGYCAACPNPRNCMLVRVDAPMDADTTRPDSACPFQCAQPRQAAPQCYVEKAGEPVLDKRGLAEKIASKIASKAEAAFDEAVKTGAGYAADAAMKGGSVVKSLIEECGQETASSEVALSTTNPDDKTKIAYLGGKLGYISIHAGLLESCTPLIIAEMEKERFEATEVECIMITSNINGNTWYGAAGTDDSRIETKHCAFHKDFKLFSIYCKP